MTRSARATEVKAAEWVSPDDLVPWPGNPRRNDGKPVHAVAASIERFGFGAPIVARKANREIIAGHTRWKAARHLGLTEVPVRFLDISEREAHLLALADNRQTELTPWDEPALAEALSDFGLEDAELAGWDSEALGALADAVPDFGPLEDGEPAPGEDDLPDLPSEPVTKLGDVWTLGDHRVYCEDSFGDTAAGRIDRGDAALVFTDPPYAIYGSSTGLEADIADDRMVRPFFRNVVVRCAHVLKPFGHAYICCDWRSWSAWWESLRKSGLVAKNMVVWDKGGGLGAMYRNAHELLLFASARPQRKRMKGGAPSGERTVASSNVWRINRAGRGETGEERKHNAQKPLELVEKAMEQSADTGDHVVDFFLGSGTTLCAAERRGLRCSGWEVDPAYCDVIVERWENLTGGKATRGSA